MAKKKVSVPSDVLRKFMDDYGLKAEQLAEGIKMSIGSVRMILYGKIRIGLPAAFRLAKFFGTPAQFWIDTQLEYDISKLKDDQELQDDLSSITKVKIRKDAKSSSSSKKSDVPVKKAASKRSASSNSPAEKPSKPGRGRPAVKTASAPKSAPEKPVKPTAKKTPATPPAKPVRKASPARARKVVEPKVEEEVKKEPNVILIKRTPAPPEPPSPVADIVPPETDILDFAEVPSEE